MKCHYYMLCFILPFILALQLSEIGFHCFFEEFLFSTVSALLSRLLLTGFGNLDLSSASIWVFCATFSENVLAQSSNWLLFNYVYSTVWHNVYCISVFKFLISKIHSCLSLNTVCCQISEDRLAAMATGLVLLMLILVYRCNSADCCRSGKSERSC